MTDFTDPQAVWNQRFSTPAYLFGEEPNAFLASQAQRLGHGRALALADGEGRNSVWLAGKYDEATLRQAFSGYEVLVSQSYEAILEEGSRHKGISALVGFVARKP